MKSVLRAILIVAVLMGALTLGASSADANSSGPVCDQGILNADGQCEVEVDPIGDACPAIEEDGECFELVPVSELCEVGTPIGGGECRVSVPDTIELECLPPSEPANGGSCVEFLPAFGVVSCPGDAELINDNCWDYQYDAVQESSCANLEDVDGCYRLEPAEFICFEGFPIGNGDLCQVEVEPIEGDPECPVPNFDWVETFADGEHCGIVTEGEVECLIGISFPEHIGNGECRDYYFPEGESGCEMYFYLLEIYEFVEEWAGGCYGFSIDDDNPPCDGDGFEPGFAFGEIPACRFGDADSCPDGYEYDFEGCVLFYDGDVVCPADFPIHVGFDFDPICFQDFGLLAPTLTCPNGEPAIEGCFTIVGAVPTCANGTLTETLDCRIDEAPVLSNPFCPGGETLIGTGCYTDVGAPTVTYQCAEGVLAGTVCLVEVEPVQTPTCGEALGVPGDCYILEPAFVECPTGAVAGPEFPADCRLPVDRTGDGCPDGATDLGDRCVITSDPVYYCNNLPVTINMVLGDPGNGTSGIDVIYGTPGDDVIYGRSGADTICGGGGNDRIYGSGGADTIFGEDGADWISGSFGDDYIDGGDGNDIVYGGSNNDELWGSYGDDTLNAGSGNDQLRGGFGTDTLRGGGGNDLLRGGVGDDILNGGTGTDDCRNLPGNNTLRNCEAPILG